MGDECNVMQNEGKINIDLWVNLEFNGNKNDE